MRNGDRIIQKDSNGNSDAGDKQYNDKSINDSNEDFDKS